MPIAVPRLEMVVAQTREVMKGTQTWGIFKEETTGFLDGLDMEWKENKGIKNCSNVLAPDYKLQSVTYTLLEFSNCFT